MDPLPLVTLGRSDLRVTPICLGTMTFGEQVDEADGARHPRPRARARRQLHRHRRDVLGAGAARDLRRHRTHHRPLVRDAARRARQAWCWRPRSPARRAAWTGCAAAAANLTPADIVQACDDSLQRLQTDVIDLYQIHWPNRNVPMFGALYFDPAKDRDFSADPRAARGAGRRWCKAGKVRHIGLSQRDALGRVRVRAPGRAARPAARRDGAEPVRADQPRRRQRAGRDDAPPAACRCWPIRRWASAR